MPAEPTPTAPPEAEGKAPAGKAEEHGPIHLEAPQVTTCLPGGPGRGDGAADKAAVLVSCRLRNGDAEERDGVLTATLRDTGQVVERRFRLDPEGHNQAALPELTVMFPYLWEPLRGGPEDAPRALYSLDLEVSVHGVLSDRRRVRFGIRDVGIVDVGTPPEEGEEGEGDDDTEPSGEDGGSGAGGRPGLAVNGRPLELEKGAGVATWSGPGDAAGEGPHRYHRAVADLADRGVTLLRLPWGDTDERDALLDACDEHGLPVAAALWPDPGADAAAAEADSDLEPHERLVEAREALRRLRNHPSLVLWLGSLEGPPPESLDHCLRCYVTGSDAEGDPCRFAGQSPCGHEGVLDGNRPYRPHPGGLLPPASGGGEPEAAG